MLPKNSFYDNITVRDGLANVVTGTGTSVDKRQYNRWVMPLNIPEQVEAAYRSSWLMRKCVDLPAFDMIREGWDWNAKDTKITDIEKVQTKFKLGEKLLAALIMGRLGGGAIIIGVDQGSAAQELDIEAVTQDSLRYVHVVPHTKLIVGPIEEDPDADGFGEPLYFDLRRAGAGEPIRIHGSRVIPFKGVPTPAISNASSLTNSYWGDSVVTALDDPVQNAITAMNEFATLISEAKIDVFGIPNMIQSVGSVDYEKRLMRRLELANIGKSTHRALIRDAAETWEQHQMNWAGMPEVVRTYLAVVAGAADIPATRLLGKAPDGMNATGDADQDNYFQMIATKQENDLRPNLQRLLDVLVRSATGDYPDELSWEFAPLKVLSEEELAKLEKQWADTVKVLSDSQLFLGDALEEAFSNRMIESGLWPGYEKARKKAEAEEAKLPSPEDLAGVIPPAQPGVTPPPPNNPRPGATVPAPTPRAAPARA